ncbi:MAG: hypothetical protein IJO48_06020 [Clostridia bacterium]|nr:hypothetical protein [Clostridia bacterium]
MNIRILYEDNHLLVVEKPVNIPVQGDSSGDEDLLSMLKGYIKQKYNKPGEVYLGLVHRLDRPVGGVMVFARTSKAASRLSSQFARNTAKKRYASVVCGNTPPCEKLTCHMAKDEKTGTAYVVSASSPSAKSAALFYRRIAKTNELSLIDIELFTGRHHQIRLQCSHSGFPIWGDQRYNKSAKVGQQIALFAYSLTLTHPTTKERMTFTAKPTGKIWECFDKHLDTLMSGISLVYSDNDIIVVNKPYGLSVTIADGEKDTLESRLCSVYGTVYPVHRLDATTSGLIIFARNTQAKASLDTAIASRTLDKVYRCIVKGTPPHKEATLKSWAVKDEQSAKTLVFDTYRANAKEMITAYRVLKSKDDLSLLEVSLITGRTHQIRAHLSHIGNPILGDDKYGDRAFNAQKKRTDVHLCSIRLVLHFENSDYLARLNGKMFEITEPFSL